MLRRSANLAAHLHSPASASRQPWARWSTVSSTLGHGQRIARSDSESPPTAIIDSLGAKLARLEGILLLAREPLSTRKLAELAELADGTEARSLVRELSRRLRRRGSAMQAVEVAHGVQLLTRPQLAHWLGRLHAGGEEEPRLSAPALETLSVAAYRQPATRAEIEAIRGVQCGEILRLLMERGLLRIVGRSEELGRPFLYGTTRKFLQVFGLRRLEQLPPVDQIRNAESRTAA
jgi:segregation and condensation protein B